MKFKKFSLILFFVLIFSIGSVCAAELNSTATGVENADVAESADLSTQSDVISVASDSDTSNLKSSETDNVLTADRYSTMLIYSDMTTTAINPSIDGKKGDYFTVTLINSAGQRLSNKTIEVGFNGAKHLITTNNNGVAKLQINLAKATEPSSHTFAVFYKGDDDNRASFGVAKITIKKQTPKLTTANKSYKASAKTKKITATLKTSRGKILANKKVTFKINGKTYNVKTDKKGVATLNVNIKKKKTYSFSVKFAGDNTYKSVTKNGKLTIK